MLKPGGRVFQAEGIVSAETLSGSMPATFEGHRRPVCWIRCMEGRWSQGWIPSGPPGYWKDWKLEVKLLWDLEQRSVMI